MIVYAYNKCGKYDESLKFSEWKLEIKLDKMRKMGNDAEEKWKFLINVCHFGKAKEEVRKKADVPLGQCE